MKQDATSKGIGIGFLCIIAVIAIIQMIMPDKTFSKTENRLLHQKPNFTFTALFDGHYQKQMTDYKNDQFFMRSKWVQKKADIDYTLGIRKIQDVYIGKNDTLLQEMPDIPEQSITSLATTINQFYQTHSNLNTAVMIVPTHVALHPEYLPYHALVSDQKQLLQSFSQQLDTNIKKVPVLETFTQHKEQALYYNSDHHWTTLAAYTALDPFLSTMGFKKQAIPYETHVSNDHFYGTLSNKTGYYKQPDTVELYLDPNNSIQTIVHFSDQNENTTSLYQADKQFASNAYEVFLGGNHPRIDITTSAANNRKLLLIKDSYANAFIPFLVPYYHEIIVIDPRYYYEDITAIIDEKGIQDLVFLYNTNTFFTDTALSQALS